MTELRSETLLIPGAPLGDENPLPYFRNPAVNSTFGALASMPEEKRQWMGWETGFRVLPYRMQDSYSRQRKPLAFRSVVLENELLKATFLPELGGRLISLEDKPHRRELLHRNPVFQPANLAIRNAWFSGGIEWNIGQFGHTFTTCSPVFACGIRGMQGEPGLRIYEYERCKGFFWQIDFYLPPDFPFLVAYTRVVNPNETDVAMYWWSNIAVNESADVRVLAPADQAIYIDASAKTAAFGCADLPYLPSLKGADGTYSLNSTFANEFFFQCDAAEMPWEAALDGQGSGLIEASTPRLRYRKLFCWGSHAGGRHWQEFLSQPGEAYIEIQAGLAPTQIHGLVMPSGTTWDWTQVFGYLEADPRRAHSADWGIAWRTVDDALKRRLPAHELERMEGEYRNRADQAPGVSLQTGAGWGALETRRRGENPSSKPLPEAFLFPAISLGDEQRKWLGLLESGDFPEPDPAELPGEWMTQAEWRQLLENAVQEKQASNWFAWLHLGVMRLEAFDEAGAQAAWEESLRLRPSLWAYRNLGLLYLRQNGMQLALESYAQAWGLAGQHSRVPEGIAVEYLRLLIGERQFARAWEVLASCPAQVGEADRIQILRAQIALDSGDLDSVEAALRREYAIVQEGETVLTDLWFELQARRRAAQTGQPLTDELRQQVKVDSTPPAGIDFRSVNET